MVSNGSDRGDVIRTNVTTLRVEGLRVGRVSSDEFRSTHANNKNNGLVYTEVLNLNNRTSQEHAIGTESSDNEYSF